MDVGVKGRQTEYELLLSSVAFVDRTRVAKADSTSSGDKKEKYSPNSPMRKNYSWGYSYLYGGFHRIRPFPFGMQNAAAGLHITAFRRQRGKCEALDRRDYSSSLTELFLTVFGRQRGSPVAIFSQPSTEHSVLGEEDKLLILLLLVLVLARLICFLDWV